MVGQSAAGLSGRSRKAISQGNAVGGAPHSGKPRTRLGSSAISMQGDCVTVQLSSGERLPRAHAVQQSRITNLTHTYTCTHTHTHTYTHIHIIHATCTHSRTHGSVAAIHCLSVILSIAQVRAGQWAPPADRSRHLAPLRPARPIQQSQRCPGQVRASRSSTAKVRASRSSTAQVRASRSRPYMARSCIQLDEGGWQQAQTLGVRSGPPQHRRCATCTYCPCRGGCIILHAHTMLCCHLPLTPPPPTVLGAMPGPAAISTVPIFSVAGQAIPPSHSVANPLPLTSTLPTGTGGGLTPTIAPSAKMDQAIVLSSALPPMSAKVVGKIKSGQYTPMKDLVAAALSG